MRLQQGDCMLTPEDKLERFINRKIEDLYTFVPGHFTHIHHGTFSADAKMSIPMKSNVTGVTNSVVVLRNVPIVFPMGSGFAMTYPVQKGDHCLLVFAHSELTEWKKSTEPLTKVTRCLRYDINNAVAIVGGYSPLNCKIKYPNGLDDQNIHVYGSVQMDGKVTIGNVNNVEAARSDGVINVLRSLLNALEVAAKALATPPLTPVGTALETVAKTFQASLSANQIKSGSLYID